MDIKNLIYMSFVNIKEEKTVVSYPDPEPEIYFRIIEEVRTKIFDSFKGSSTGIEDLEVEGISVFFISDDSNEIGAFVITLGQQYPKRFADSLLNDLLKLVLTNGYKKGDKAVGIQRQIEPELYDLFHKYDSVVETDQVTLVRAKTDFARENIEDSMIQVMESVGNVQVLKESSVKLKDQSKNMFKSAKKVNAFYRNKRFKMIAGVSGLALIVIIIIALIIYFSVKK